MNAFKADYRLSEKAQELCKRLYLVAKKSKTRRFHQLYDKVYRMDILSDAWSKKYQKSARRWKTDYTWKIFIKSGAVIMTGNTQYWSKASKAQE